MKKQIKETTFKLITELLQAWMDSGDDKYAEAAREVLRIIKGLR